MRMRLHQGYFIQLGLITVEFLSDPLSPLGVCAPPLENLTVERTVLSDRGISLLVRAEGSEPMQIAQVQVDGSYCRWGRNEVYSRFNLGNASFSVGRHH